MNLTNPIVCRTLAVLILLTLSQCGPKVISKETLPLGRGNAKEDLADEITKYKGGMTSYNKDAASIMAFIQVLSKDVGTIPGKTVQNTFDKLNPAFKSKNQKLYNNLGELSFAHKTANTVTFYASDEKVKLDKMTIVNGARATIEEGNGIITLKVLEGITAAWFDIRSIKMELSTGNVEIRYGSKGVKEINLTKDVLD